MDEALDALRKHGIDEDRIQDLETTIQVAHETGVDPEAITGRYWARKPGGKKVYINLVDWLLLNELGAKFVKDESNGNTDA